MSKTSADDRSNQAVLPVSISTLPPLGIWCLPHDLRGSIASRPVRAEDFRSEVSRTVYARFPARDGLFRTCEETLTSRGRGVVSEARTPGCAARNRAAGGRASGD